MDPISEKEQLARKIEIVELQAHKRSKIPKFEESKQNGSGERIKDDSEN